MNTEDATETLSNAWIAAWPSLAPGVTFQMENVAFVEPDPTSGASWCRVTYVHNAPVRETIGSKGNRRKRCSGYIYVQIFTPLDQGRKPNDVLGTKVRSVFELSTFGPAGDQLITEETGPAEGGNEGRWYMSTIATPFRYYQRV